MNPIISALAHWPIPWIVLSIIGFFTLAGIPGVALGFWLGWNIRRRREAPELTEARNERGDMISELNARDEADARIIRLMESARTSELRAREQYRLAEEILRGRT
jgi:hypothetical protein